MNTCEPESLVVDDCFVNEFLIDPAVGATHTQTIQQALDACAEQGGGRVVLRPGVHHSGTIHLRSRVTLHLEKGAVLFGSANVADYGRKSGEQGGRILNGVATALVFADGASDIAITGEGTIDGNGRSFWKKPEKPADWIEEKKALGLWIPSFNCATKERPRALILLTQCRNVRIENVRVQNSPSWTIHPLACTDLTIRGITLRGAVDGSNTDGIDLDGCSNVLVEDCDIETGDDALALKNTNGWGFKRPSRNITVRRCRLCSTTHGFTIGTETQEDFEDITLTDSLIETAFGYRTLTGLGLSILDGGAIRRLRVSNVTINDAIAPIQIRLGNAGRGQAAPTPGMLEDITIENVFIRRAEGNSMILGLPGHPLRRIAIRNVHVEFTGAIDPGNVLAEVPQLPQEFPINKAWKLMPAYGFFCRDVDGLEWSNVTLTAPVEEKRPDLLFHNIQFLS